MDKARIEKAVREILIAIGEDPDREGFVETPKRVANMYEEIFAGLDSDPHRLLKVFDEVRGRGPAVRCSNCPCRTAPDTTGPWTLPSRSLPPEW